MLTDEHRRLMKARNRVKSTLVDPVNEMIEASLALVGFYKKRADEAYKIGYADGHKAGRGNSNDRT